MSKKQSLMLFILPAGALVLLLWFVRPQPEPVYHNRPLSLWLKDLENWDGDTSDPAFVAFREMGTNALPELLDDIQSGGPTIQRMILKINKMQSVVKLPFGEPWSQTMAATWGLYAMGTNAKPALRVLTNLLFRTNSIYETTTALAGIGSDGVPPLLAALTNADYRIRLSAASGLAWEHSDFDVVVPALIASLQDNNRLVRMSAIISLGQIHVKPELVVPALINAFTNNDTLPRSLVLIALGQFKSGATNSVPMVMAALNDQDEGVRTSAGFAIKQIDPEAAEKAGVK